MRGLVIFCMSVAAACSETPGQITDITPDGKVPAFTGLTLDFIADTELPARISEDVRVEEIYLHGAVIRAIGDATTQDEQPTTGRDHPLRWDADEAPRELAFSAAPVGAYAYVELRIAGGDDWPRYAFEIRGEARESDGDWIDYVIRAEAPVVIANVPAAMRLEAGRPLTIRIELDVDRLVEGIDWESLPERDNRLRLDESTPGPLASFCTRLAGAFRAF